MCAMASCGQKCYWGEAMWQQSKAESLLLGSSELLNPSHWPPHCQLALFGITPLVLKVLGSETFQCLPQSPPWSWQFEACRSLQSHPGTFLTKENMSWDRSYPRAQCFIGLVSEGHNGGLCQQFFSICNTNFCCCSQVKAKCKSYAEYLVYCEQNVYKSCLSSVAYTFSSLFPSSSPLQVFWRA